MLINEIVEFSQAGRELKSVVDPIIILDIQASVIGKLGQFQPRTFEGKFTHDAEYLVGIHPLRLDGLFGNHQFV